MRNCGSLQGDRPLGAEAFPIVAEVLTLSAELLRGKKYGKLVSNLIRQAKDLGIPSKEVEWAEKLLREIIFICICLCACIYLFICMFICILRLIYSFPRFWELRKKKSVFLGFRNSVILYVVAQFRV